MIFIISLSTLKKTIRVQQIIVIINYSFFKDENDVLERSLDSVEGVIPTFRATLTSIDEDEKLKEAPSRDSDLSDNVIIEAEQIDTGSFSLVRKQSA